MWIGCPSVERGWCLLRGAIYSVQMHGRPYCGITAIRFDPWAPFVSWSRGLGEDLSLDGKQIRVCEVSTDIRCCIPAECREVKFNARALREVSLSESKFVSRKVTNRRLPDQVKLAKEGQDLERLLLSSRSN